MTDYLKKTLEHFGGKQTKLAETLGVTQACVSLWFKKIKDGKLAPEAADCVKIEHLSNGVITSAQLRPDIFIAPKRRNRK